MTIFAVCRYVISNDASRIESCFHFPWIVDSQRLTSISETEPHLAVLYNHPQRMVGGQSLTLLFLYLPQFSKSLKI